jgi:multiple sugar transport system substrate-binding protein
MAKQAETFMPPVANNGSRIEQIMKATIESVFLGKAEAAGALKLANVQVKAAAK